MKHYIGIDDDMFIRGKTPMTKKEIRILTMAAARLHDDSVVLDVGAGTGSLTIEAALAASDGHVYAIEKNDAALELINANCQKFNVGNVTVIKGSAAASMEDLPPLDAVFVGGAGREMPAVINKAARLLKPGGKMIINCVTVESQFTALNALRAREDMTYDAVSVQITRFNKIAAYHMGQALNPITIITCTKSFIDIVGGISK